MVQFEKFDPSGKNTWLRAKKTYTPQLAGYFKQDTAFLWASIAYL
jgi:hypothetical protein